MIDKKEYRSIHSWLRYHYGRAYMCQDKKCNGTCFHYQYSLIKGKQHERNRKHYKMRCAKCHSRYDWTKDKNIQRQISGKANLGVKKSNTDNYKGRTTPTVIGEKQWNSKLNDTKVRQIKIALKSGCQNKELAETYQVNKATISDISKNRSWKHINI